VSTVREVLDAASARLAQAGVESPGHDAAELLAHVLGTTRGQLVTVHDVADDAAATFADLVSRRAERVPLQHLTGSTGFRHLEIEVGPGVFVPRPETELLAGWAIERLAQGFVAVDLCTGSGAIAASIAHEAPGVHVHAVELDPAAHAWAERNLEGMAVDLRQGDMVQAFHDLDGTVDVVVSNPPYIPHEAWESVAVEARDHDPHAALFSAGEDGHDAIRTVEDVAARLLKPGGWVGVEHADVQGESAPQVFASSGRWVDVRDHRDLAGRPRYLTARRA
jgi:release factor glutamine methyltransferase